MAAHIPSLLSLKFSCHKSLRSLYALPMRFSDNEVPESHFSTFLLFFLIVLCMGHLHEMRMIPANEMQQDGGNENSVHYHD